MIIFQFLHSHLLLRGLKGISQQKIVTPSKIQIINLTKETNQAEHIKDYQDPLFFPQKTALKSQKLQKNNRIYP